MRARLFLTILFVGGISLQSHAVSELSSSCPGTAELVDFEFTSSFHLIDSLVKVVKKTHKDFVEKSVVQHIKYLQSDLKLQLHTLGIDAVFSDKPAQILSTQIRHSHLLFDFYVSPITHPDVLISNKYIHQAIALKKIKNTAATTMVEYKSSVAAYVCVPEHLSNWQTQLKDIRGPSDPWLAHWLVPTDFHQKVRWKKSEFTIPPYFDSEYADIPDPQLAWYFWNPQYKAKDMSGVSYTAAEFYNLNREILTAKVKASLIKSLERFNGLTTNVLNLNKARLTSTVIFGITDPKSMQLKLNKIFTSDKTGYIDTWRPIAQQLRAWNTKSEIDLGSMYATGFLLNLDHFLDMKSLSFKYNQSSNLLILNAKLFNSQRSIRIHFYFGPTDLLAGRPPKHWQIAKQGLVQDDIVFYTGHSGLGENFKWSNFEKYSSLKNLASLKSDQPVQQRPDNQIIGVFSCYSASYFDQDLSARMGKNSVLILTGSSYTSARGPVGVLSMVDTILAKQSMANMPLVDPTDFLIFKQNKGVL